MDRSRQERRHLHELEGSILIVIRKCMHAVLRSTYQNLDSILQKQLILLGYSQRIHAARVARNKTFYYSKWWRVL